MELYPHHTPEGDKVKARNLFSNEKSLLNIYDSMLVRQKEGTVKADIYNMLKDEKEILNQLEEKLRLMGWI